MVAANSRNRRAGELLGAGTPSREIETALGHAAEGLDALPLLVYAMREHGVPAPAVEGLTAVVEGREDPEAWAAGIDHPGSQARRVAGDRVGA